MPEPILEQRIQFCTAKDGTRIACAKTGDGYPLVRAAHWLTHLEFDLESPVWNYWIRELSRFNTYIRYDERGFGLSDWNPADLSFESFVTDLESVVDFLDLRRFALLGGSQGGAVGIAYAARHPERVSHLILYASFGRGLKKAGARARDPEALARWESLGQMIELGWGRDNPAYRQLFTSLFIPEANAAQVRWFNELQKVSCPPKNAVRLLDILANIDVLELLAKVTVPTLVLHARHDEVIPFEAGRGLAARIAGARFVPFEGRNHILLESDPGWSIFLRETRRFLGVGEGGATDVLPPTTRSDSAAVGTQRLLAQMEGVNLSSFAIAGNYVRYSPTVRNQLKDWKQRVLGSLASARSAAENYLIWGSPGSGKSYLVQELARSQGNSVRYHEINLAECDEGSFALRLQEVTHERGPCLCLIDEVDAKPVESWPYEQLLPHLARGDPGAALVNILAGSSTSSILEMKQRIAARPKGPDLLSRIPADNELVIPGLEPGDSALVILAQLKRAGAKLGHPVREVEKLALCYILLNPRLSSARQLGEFARQCVERLPSAEDRVKYDHLFRAGDPENKAFWNRIEPQRSELVDMFVSIGD
jgi:pimeloyl-ACP methyl ester carboxylesterase